MFTGAMEWMHMVEEQDMDDLFDDEDDGVIVDAEVVTETEQAKAFSKSLPTRQVKSFMEIYEDEEDIKWFIEGIMPLGGLVYLGGISATGKTILAIQMCVDIILKRNTMTWKLGADCPEQPRVLLLSLEMTGPELKRRLNDMYPNLTDDERKILDENLVIYSDPEPFKLHNGVHAAELVQLIAINEINLVLIDSASVAFGDSLNEIKEVNKSIEHLYAIRSRLKTSMLVVAHTRKPLTGSTSPEDITINDLFGHSGVAQSASSIILLQEDEKQRKQTVKDGNGDEVEKVVHMINVKSRFSGSNGSFKAKLPSKKNTLKGVPLMFRRDAIELPPISPERKKLGLGSTIGLPISASFEGIDVKKLAANDKDSDDI